MAKFVTQYDVFLLETKVFAGVLQRLGILMGFEGMIHVDPMGQSGGLAFF